MLQSLHWPGAICTPGAALQGGLLLGLFAAGVAGSLIHCGPMCGVLVLGQMSERMARMPPHRLCEWQRARSGLLLPYHLGRLTTYAALGAVAATSTAMIGRFAWFNRLSAAMLTLAALLFLAHALQRLSPAFGMIDQAPRLWRRLITAAGTQVPRGSAFGEYLFGIAMGLLPCGFLFAAILAAAAAGQPGMGAAAMLAFGLGTTPILMVIGVAGYFGARRWNHAMTAAAPVLMVLNAALLLMLAWARLA